MNITRRIRDRARAALPPAPRQDAAILRDVRRALIDEPLLGNCSIHPNGTGQAVRYSVLFPEGCAGDIEVSVERGVVTLAGRVGPAVDRRLPGTIARKTRGCRGVVNRLELRK